MKVVIVCFLLALVIGVCYKVAKIEGVMESIEALAKRYVMTPLVVASLVLVFLIVISFVGV